MATCFSFGIGFLQIIASGYLPRCSDEHEPYIYFFSLELFKSPLLFHVCKDHIWYTFQVTPVLVSIEVLLDFVS